MKQSTPASIASILLTVTVSTLAAATDMSSNAIGPPRTNSTTIMGQTKPLPRPDLIVQPVSEVKLPMFLVKNVGAANSGQSIVQVQCHTMPAAAAGVPCMPNVHYINVIASPPSPGTMMTVPNVWRIPVSSLSASGGEAKLHVSVIPKANQTNGLKFRVCADVTEAIVESSETNNCATFVFNLPS
jgi:hypothetical protein